MAGIPFGAIYVALAAYTLSRSTIANFFLVSVLVAFAKFVYNMALYPAFFTPLKHLPSPSHRSWLTGNTNSYFIMTPSTEMRNWLKEVPNNGLVRYYITGNLERVLLTKPKALSELLVTKVYDFPKPEFVRSRLAPVTGEHGVLLVEGDEHKKQRKNLMPAFAYRHIKDLYPIFWAKSAEMAQMIEKDLKARTDPTDNVVCVGAWATRATLDIIGVAGMDHDFNSLQDPNNELAQQYHKIMAEPSTFAKLLFVLGMLIGFPNLASKLPSKRNAEMNESSQFIRDVARQMIRQKREKLESKTAKNDVDIISVALESGTFTEDDLIDQMMTFLAAGHETTSTALQWVAYALCKHPDMQERLREEVRANLPSISTESPEPLSAATLDGLPYLNAFCNEVLRFHPSVPGTVRTAARDTSLLGVPIPKGTLLLLSPEVINRSEELWGPDAHEFNPERWLGPGKANTGGASSNYAYLTFIHGPRSCIGQGFAKAELACLVAAMIGKFKIEAKYPDAKLDVRIGATVRPRDGVLAKFTPLEGW
ncbi:cytochrome P450 [Aspergillus ambiguus]|uniref:cytochrome P450 n=1 Tax=Aspergillus ambiguus TaxID=176160 RepID=UPI003CCDAA76